MWESALDALASAARGGGPTTALLPGVAPEAGDGGGDDVPMELLQSFSEQCRAASAAKMAARPAAPGPPGSGAAARQAKPKAAGSGKGRAPSTVPPLPGPGPPPMRLHAQLVGVEGNAASASKQRRLEGESGGGGGGAGFFLGGGRGRGIQKQKLTRQHATSLAVCMCRTRMYAPWYSASLPPSCTVTLPAVLMSWRPHPHPPHPPKNTLAHSRRPLGQGRPPVWGPPACACPTWPAGHQQPSSRR